MGSATFTSQAFLHHLIGYATELLLESKEWSVVFFNEK